MGSPGHTLKRCAAIAWVVSTFAVGGARAQTDEERALEAVRSEIQTIERRLARQTARRDAQVDDLKTAELAVATASVELASIGARLREQRDRQQALAAESTAAAARLVGERASLARQVRLSYMTGREELFKLLLSQESPAALGRMLVYYDYFNRARSRRIDTVAAELGRLAVLAAESRGVETELERLRADQARELAAQEAARAERRSALATLEAAIAAEGGQIERLRAEEERLAALVVELAALLAGFPRESDEPFASLKGRLAWPVQGRLAQQFGQPRGGGPLRWNGVLVAASAGTPVRAVYHGRIAFSDWLPGLGLLVIVDHGDGYMSLYGHNEALLKESGDWVVPGETIAQVGDSGGQAEPVLYFEIRQDGEPVDPGQWVPAALRR